MARSSDFPNGVAGHVVSMTLDHTVSPSLSVATCACGQFQNKVEWRRENHAVQDLAIEAHWRDVAEPDA
jgi:hypothetical protein